MATKNVHKAGAFDIRNVIGGLIGIYGVFLLLSSAFLDPGLDPTTGELKNSGYNLWAGLALVIVAVIFFVWAKVKPIIVDEDQLPAAS